MVNFYYNFSSNETSTHLKCLVNIYQLSSWSIVASDWFTGSRFQQLVRLDKCLECCLRVTNTLQTMVGFLFFSTSPNFCFWWFSIPFFKGLHIHLCYQCLGPFDVIKVCLKLYKLNIIVDATFFLFAITICSLKHPTLISRLIITNFDWLHLHDIYTGQLT